MCLPQVRGTEPERWEGIRLVRGVRLATLVVAVWASATLAPEVWGLVPRPLRGYGLEAGLLAVLCVLLVTRWAGNRWPNHPSIQGKKRALARLDEAAGWLERVGLPWGISLVCGVLLLVWAPSYLARPWFRDADAFASMAQAWDAGIAPYRDIRAYNFPGHIYACWILGKMFGWGRTAPFHALDLFLFLALVAAVLRWSVAAFQGVLPGLLALLALVWYYLSTSYMFIPERDWQAALLGVLGILILRIWPARWGIAASGILVAAGATLRPHVVFLMPALLVALREDESTCPGGRGWAVRSCGWFAVFLGAVLAFFLPVIAQGLLPGWLDALRLTTPGGPYARSSWEGAWSLAVRGLRAGISPWVLGCCVWAALFARGRMQAEGRIWTLAIVGAIAWRVLHPMPHDYLILPRVLITRVALAIPARLVLDAGWMGRTERLLICGWLLVQAMPGVPGTWNLQASWEGVVALARGEPPSKVPTGCEPGRWGPTPHGYKYSWADYRDMLIYVKQHTSHTTRVANVLRRFPFPAVNGPVGRIDPFRVESGICWMWLVREDRDADFARAVAAERDAVVVWAPDERADDGMELPGLVEAIRAHYTLEARFGEIEVWRRVPAG